MAFLQKYRYSLILLRQLVITDFKLRYQGSVLGYMWSLLRPLMLFAILYVVFAQFLRLGDTIPNYPIYLLTGIVLWNFFSEITNNSVTAIVDKGDLIRKINFPKYVIILSAAFSALINLFLNFIVIGIFIWFSDVDLGWSALLVPLFVFELFVFAMALAFILSALFVRLRDINYIWEVIMQGMFYATPIIYPLSLVTEKWPEVAKLLLINPVAQSIQDIRYALVTKETDTLASIAAPIWTLIPLTIILITGLAAVMYFKKRSLYFAEEV
ncbi:LPS ABC transporter [Candidatus Saccharibacteria bacterium]|nr:MAG: LPS ABC transporter [Candidatus Saccharibacteria bacterium]